MGVLILGDAQGRGSCTSGARPGGRASGWTGLRGLEKDTVQLSSDDGRRVEIQMVR
jgi:hypothetical protein